MKKMFTYLLIAILLTTTMTPMINTTYAIEARTQSPSEWFDITNGVLNGFSSDYFGYGSTPTTIVIPEGVVEIGEDAFFLTDLESVTFPSTLKTIGSNAFKCPFLEDIKLNEGLETIGPGAFNSTSIRSITLPNSVKTLSDGAFSHCENLSAIQLNEGLTTLGEYAFSGTAITSIIIPKNITTIAKGLFQGCENLTNAVMQNNIETIGEYAFSSTGLKRINLPSSVTEIGKYAFSSSFDLSTVNLNDGLKTIGNGVFCDTNLTSITIPSTVESIGSYAFYANKNLNEILNNSYSANQVIGVDAFSNHSGSKIAYGYDANVNFKTAITAAGYEFQSLGEPNINNPESFIVNKIDTIYDIKTIKAGNKPIGPIISIYKDLLNTEPKSTNSKAAKRAESFLKSFTDSCVATFNK